MRSSSPTLASCAPSIIIPARETAPRRHPLGMLREDLGSPGKARQVWYQPRPLPPLTEPREVRLWGEDEDHIGLPDVVWVRVEVDREAYRLTTDEGDLGAFPLHPFYLAKYPVTSDQYQAFLDAPDGFGNPAWWVGLAAHDDKRNIPGRQFFKFANHPRETASWFDAVAFCRWLSARLGRPELPTEFEPGDLAGFTGLRLPTEWEWQFAATGGDPNNGYPWGPDWDEGVANTSDSGLGRSTAVGMYPGGNAPCGALDMSGNVWEWCLNERERPGRVGLSGDTRRVLRGGSWGSGHEYARAAYPGGDLPNSRSYIFGFRLAVSAPARR